MWLTNYKVNAVRSLLSWTHYRIFLNVKDERARVYYMNAAADQRWSIGELERQIGTQFYKRLLASSSEEISTTQVEDKALQNNNFRY
jgi:predicted nuclease of restriction endonuclease-like (RecB) superfamily